MTTHYTARGEIIDMNALAMKHPTTPALGNAKMNARGDLLGQGGIVLKTQEQIEAEWKRNKEMKTASVGISPDIKKALPDNILPPSKKLEDDQDFDPAPPTNGDQVKNIMQQTQPSIKRRKIVDSDS